MGLGEPLAWSRAILVSMSRTCIFSSMVTMPSWTRSQTKDLSGKGPSGSFKLAGALTRVRRVTPHDPPPRCCGWRDPGLFSEI